MYVGTQYLGTSKVEMEFLVRHGVTHFDATVDDMKPETLITMLHLTKANLEVVILIRMVI